MSVGLLYGRNVFQTGVKRYAEELERELRAQGEDVERVEIARRELRFGKLRVGGFVSFWLARLAKAPRHDVVHALAPALAVRGTDVLTIHDLTEEVFPQWYQRGLATRADIRLTRAIGRRVPWLVADSEVTRQHAIKLWKVAPERVVTVHLGIDPERFQPTSERTPLLAEDKPNLVFTGDDNPRKNIALAVRAVAALRREHGIDARLVRVGPTRDPDVHDAYRREAKEQGVDLVEPGFVDDRDLVSLYSHADAFLWPPVAEGFGLPPLEAMACGAPVVALDTPINREVGGPLACYHRDDASDAAAAIARVLAHPPAREALRAYASQFTWARTAARTREVYARVREGKRR
jgi:glycosyltransferase involved in cell wall biosynthesis